jgi:hypothetical protein
MCSQIDPTEETRRVLQASLNSDAHNRQELEKAYGQVWDTKELQEDYTVEGFKAPYVGVIRKSDGKRGSLIFQHHPRFYWWFREK